MALADADRRREVKDGVDAAERPADGVVVADVADVELDRLLAETGATLRWLDVTPEGRLDLDDLDSMITGRTRIVAGTHQSNVTGTVPPVAGLARAARLDLDGPGLAGSLGPAEAAVSAAAADAIGLATSTIPDVPARAAEVVPDPPRNGTQAHAASDPALERYFHLHAMNRGVLITPFHNMALMSPVTQAADVDRHTEVFSEAVSDLLGRS